MEGSNEDKKRQSETQPKYDSMAWNSKGWGLASIGKFKEAIENYDKALELDSNFIYSWIGKCWSSFALGKTAEIVEFSNKFIESNSEAAWIARIWSSLVLGKDDQPLDDYEKYLILRKSGEVVVSSMFGDVDSRIEWLFKAYLFDRLEKFDEALDCINKAIDEDVKKLYDHNDFLVTFKAKVIYSTGRYDDVILYCDKSISNCYRRIEDKFNLRNPNLAYALTIKGNALCHLRKFEEAIECYDKALQIKPTWPGIVLYSKNGILLSNDFDANTWWNRKINEISSLDIKSILLFCDKFLENGPNNAYAWVSKGDITFNIGKFEEAIECYDKALQIKPTYALAQTNKGNTLCHLRKFEEAIECYDKALQIKPTYALAQTNKQIVMEGKLKDIY